MENAPFHASMGIDESRQHRYHAAVHVTEMSNAVAAREEGIAIIGKSKGGLERHLLEGTKCRAHLSKACHGHWVGLSNRRMGSENETWRVS